MKSSSVTIFQHAYFTRQEGRPFILLSVYIREIRGSFLR